jgi:hypothetical protein
MASLAPNGWIHESREVPRLPKTGVTGTHLHETQLMNALLLPTEALGISTLGISVARQLLKQVTKLGI